VIMASDFAAVFLLIYGLKRMASPVTARTGIIVAGLGMLVAILASFLYALQVRPTAAAHLPINAEIAAIALVAGVSWAWWRGRTVAITAMPQMVALYNGMGGGAAAAIAAVELVGGGERASTALGVTVLGALIGTTSLAGSLVAWAKLDGRIKRPWRFRGQRFCNAAGAHPCTGVGRVSCGERCRGFRDHRAVLPRGTCSGRGADVANRWRRHARRDRAFQRLYGARRRARGIRAREPHDHDRGHGRRFGGHASDAADGTGDEPVGRQMSCSGISAMRPLILTVRSRAISNPRMPRTLPYRCAMRPS
jgi:hypothetical protein